MRRRIAVQVVVVCSTAILIGCGEIENAEADAIGACQLRAGKFFPIVAQRIEAAKQKTQREDAEAGDAVAGGEPLTPLMEAMIYGSPMSFRFVSTGHYVAETEQEDSTFRLVCGGDFNRRTITSIQFNGIIKRPSAGVVWSF